MNMSGLASALKLIKTITLYKHTCSRSSYTHQKIYILIYTYASPIRQNKRSMYLKIRMPLARSRTTLNLFSFLKTY